MEISIKATDQVLLVGDSDLIACTAVCLLTAGHQLSVCTQNTGEFEHLVSKHMAAQGKEISYQHQLVVNTMLTQHQNCKLIIAITRENALQKKALLQQLAPVIAHDAIVGINTESIDLTELQSGFARPLKLIGLNWTEPAHTTYFLEIIAGEEGDAAANEINRLAKQSWAKDPYIVKNNGIRSRLVSAMAREAAYLVDNGYASVDDIDRACRNDAGYYLPFCGNFRYMDLMGTYAYGMVMKDLNPDLSKDTKLPKIIEQVLQDGGQGMQNNKGFYTYTDEEVDKWKNVMDKFSYQIQAIIEKYPFNYNKETYTD